MVSSKSIGSLRYHFVLRSVLDVVLEEYHIFLSQKSMKFSETIYSTYFISTKTLSNPAGKQARVCAASLCALVHLFCSYGAGKRCWFAVEEGEFHVNLHLGGS